MQDNNNKLEQKGNSSLENLEGNITNGSSSPKFFSHKLKTADSKSKTSEIAGPQTEDPISFLDVSKQILPIIWAYVCGGDFGLYPKFLPSNLLLQEIFLVCEPGTQNSLLVAEIQKENLYFLYSNEKIINFFNLSFKEISGFKKNGVSLLLYIMNCAQSDLLEEYLGRAEQKKQGIKKSVADKILELKAKGFHGPVELKTQIVLRDQKLTKEEIDNCKKLLSKFKDVAQRDLSSYLSSLSLAKRKFAELYLNILLMNEEEWQIYMQSSGGFEALMLTPLDDFRIKLGNGDFGIKVREISETKTNGLMLLVQLGNLRILNLCSKNIESLIASAIDLNTESISAENRLIHLGKLLAKSFKNEAVLQFLFEKGAAKLHMREEYDYYSLAYLCAAQIYVESLMLSISWDINVKSPCSARTPLLAACDSFSEICIIILLAAKINIDKTILEFVVGNAYGYFKHRDNERYRTTWQKYLKLISLLLAAGADSSKLNPTTAKKLEEMRGIIQSGAIEEASDSVSLGISPLKLTP
jgi:hypothetical protein